jgi:thiamine pyrophosphate-dependent acetolactate synthase large subunit-like protein
MGAIGKAGDKIEYVQVRHEVMAAFMTCVHSKFTREVGMCLATSGPGAIVAFQMGCLTGFTSLFTVKPAAP